MKSRYGKPHVGWTAALALLVLPAPAAADQTDPRLTPLFEVLQSATTPDRIGYAERFIWMIWHESGREDVDRLMETGIEEMGSGRLRESIATFGRIIDLAPEFAEGWNKRATARYLAGELDASIEGRGAYPRPRAPSLRRPVGPRASPPRQGGRAGRAPRLRGDARRASARAGGAIPRAAPAREAQRKIHLTGRRRRTERTSAAPKAGPPPAHRGGLPASVRAEGGSRVQARSGPPLSGERAPPERL